MKRTTSQRAVLIVNPVAGQGRASKHIDHIVRLLTEGGLHVDLAITRHKGEASDEAQKSSERGDSRVIVAGGDGTINEVINSLTGTNTPLAVIPLGTGNVFALDAKIPLSIPGACKVALHGNVRSVDVGRANDRNFLLMAGIGFDAHVVHHVPLEWKERLKDYAYLVTTFRKFFHWQASRFSFRLDDGPTVRRRAWLAMVGNAASYAWNIKVTSLARMDDGLLDFCLFPGRSKIDHARQVVRTLMGQHIENGEVEYLKARRIYVDADPPVPVQLDGDTVTSTPVDISVLPRALKVIVPHPVGGNGAGQHRNLESSNGKSIPAKRHSPPETS